MLSTASYGGADSSRPWGHRALVDAQQLLRQARRRADVTQRELARVAGTSRSTVVAYETGSMSPTVRQLTRLVRACGLQLSVTLEPLDADLDRVLDSALSAPAPAPLWRLPRLRAGLAERAVPWAVDGRTALSLQGLALPHDEVAVVLLDGAATRSWLHFAWARVYDADGFRLAPTWEEPPDVVATYLRRIVHTRFGDVRLRLAEQLPEGLPLDVEGELMPVLPLLDVEDAHPSLAALLTRFRERRAAACAAPASAGSWAADQDPRPG